jgi:hypothetical protein
MRVFTSVLLLASAAIASAQSSSTSASLSSASGSSSMSAELAAIAECNSTQLDAAQAVLQSNEREAQCESALGLSSGTMLQVTTAQATEMCDTASCRAALQQLYDAMPNCRYNLWGLKYSAQQLLEYCGITPTESSSVSSSSSGSVGWSVVDSNSASFAAAGATDAPATASSTTSASSAAAATSSGSSAAASTTAVSAALAATAGLVAAFLA